MSLEVLRLDSPETRVDGFETAKQLLGALGLYNAAGDLYQGSDHPEDEQWIIQSNN